MARIKTTPMVKFALWALRVYLLILLSLIGLKFYRTYHSGTEATPSAAAAIQATNSPVLSK